ncbi:MAG: ABC transporter permease subunit [Firmicutes bacterium]|uniref:ABC transporter permease subunit n=1 Tax=Candidatus Alloenteromonas pullistercoris TaxID=2840785 RepID=A0A9D9DFF5_9FIRM|nr:ABC transporter permease subunit [Candidatus Enteromonas pullistercoris]
MKSLKASKILSLTIIYIILGVCAIIWVLPFVWLFLQSLSANELSQSNFAPPVSEWNLKNYAYILGITIDGRMWPEYADSTSSIDAVICPSTGMTYYLTWFFNTLVLAVIVCIINTMFVMMVAYAMSRFRFKARELLMKLNLVLGMFPGFLGMIIMYWVMKEIFHLQGTFWALIFIYCGGSGMGFFVSKGFFDTVSYSIDEAAMIDGANRAQIFWDIILPLSKPIVVYTILTAFMSPWGDYITSSYIIGIQNSSNWTIAIGLYKWATDTKNYINYYTRYAAGSVLLAIPLAILFIATQRYYVAGVTGGAVKG